MFYHRIFLPPEKILSSPKKIISSPEKIISSPEKIFSSPERIQKIKIKKKLLNFMAIKLSFRIQKIIGTNI
jgi:hypothetical protein